MGTPTPPTHVVVVSGRAIGADPGRDVGFLYKHRDSMRRSATRASSWEQREHEAGPTWVTRTHLPRGVIIKRLAGLDAA